MRKSYNDLRCPNCGSKKLEIVSDDVFICEYCNQKTNFALEEIIPSIENKVFVEELKEKFYEKIKLLNQEKSQAYADLLHYKNLAKPTKFVFVYRILFVLTFFLFFASFTFLVEDTSLFLICFLLSILCCVVVFLFFRYSKQKNRKIREKYQPYISLYASKIVDYENKIKAYSRAISKLIK